MGITGSFHAIKRAKREAGDILPRSDKIRNEWSYKTTLLVSLNGTQRDKFILYFNFRNLNLHKMCVSVRVHEKYFEEN